jgi:hypothetical protein
MNIHRMLITSHGVELPPHPHVKASAPSSPVNALSEKPSILQVQLLSQEISPANEHPGNNQIGCRQHPTEGDARSRLAATAEPAAAGPGQGHDAKGQAQEAQQGRQQAQQERADYPNPAVAPATCP